VSCKLNESVSHRVANLLIKLAFGDVALSRCVTFDWFKRFKDGCISIKDDHHPGRPSTSKTNITITLVQDKIRSDRRWFPQNECQNCKLRSKWNIVLKCVWI
jgi:hypothetical protein